jgi:hypothetical protein
MPLEPETKELWRNLFIGIALGMLGLGLVIATSRWLVPFAMMAAVGVGVWVWARW